MYRLKYRNDRNSIQPIVEAVISFARSQAIEADVIVPVPPSKLQRPYQPVIEIASELSRAMGIALDTTSLKKAKATPQMKDIGDFSERMAALETAFTVANDLNGKRVLLIDDLLQSGATINVVARTLRKQGGVKTLNAIVLTRTRG